jgi:hypothetical protein
MTLVLIGLGVLAILAGLVALVKWYLWRYSWLMGGD